MFSGVIVIRDGLLVHTGQCLPSISMGKYVLASFEVCGASELFSYSIRSVL